VVEAGAVVVEADAAHRVVVHHPLLVLGVVVGDRLGGQVLAGDDEAGLGAKSAG
jgi:hypothetical protein